MAQLKSTIVNGALSVTDTISEGGTLLSSKYVPQTRTVNGKALSSNISLSASDVSAVASNTAITAATKCKITYDSKGLVTAGANLAASDIPALNYAGLASGASSGGKAASAASADAVAWSGVSGTPTTISGYGITDAKIANGTITLGSTSITPVTDVSGKTDKATLTTKGDMYYASAASTPARLAVGSNGQFLSVASGVPTWVNNPNTNTTYTFASGTTKGSFQVTPSGGSASSVAVYGLGTAAYEDKTAFLASDGTASSVARAIFGDSSNGTHDANSMLSNGMIYGTSNMPSSSIGFGNSDGTVIAARYDDSWVTQIAQDWSGNLFVRGKNNGTWGSWKKVNAAYADSAGIATGAGDGSVVILGEHSDEVNFGGTGTNTSIYFGHRGEGSRSKPTNYYFGGTAADANVRALRFISNAISSSWYNGRDNASFTQDTVSGYCPITSIKTSSGSWETGTYDASGWENQLLFNYIPDSSYSSGYNSPSGQIKYTSSGNIYASGFYVSSKRSLKENINPFVENALDILDKVDIVSFNYISDEDKAYKVGFIADDTDEILAGKDHDKMDSSNCIGILIKAVQELKSEIEGLKEKIK